MSELTEFGFKFGSIDVSRTASDKSSGITVVSIKTPKLSFSIRATKTGFISFYDGKGNECDLVDIDYIKLEQGVNK